jgi:hypothetical protein
MAAKTTTTTSSSSSTTQEAAAHPQADPNQGDPNQVPPAVSTTTTKESDPSTYPKAPRIQPVRQIRAVRAPPLQPPLLQMILLYSLQYKPQLSPQCLQILQVKYSPKTRLRTMCRYLHRGPWRTTRDNGRYDV